jgi:Tfp pilus assembly protein PilZ
MNLWHPAPAQHAAAALCPAPSRRRGHYRHQIQTLAYLNLDQSNGGIIRNLGDAGIAVQAVAPLTIDQKVFLRFDLANPRVRVEGTGRVAWADPVGQAGIEFLTLSQRARRGLKDWIFLQLLSTAQANADASFAENADAAELLFSSRPRPAIRFDNAVTVRSAALAIGKDQRLHPVQLPWFPFAVSEQTLSRTVDGLILLSALLLFAVICIAMIGAVPAWPVALILGAGASALFALVYRYLFLFWLGCTPGSYLSRLTSNALNGINSEQDERPRFR